MSKQNRKICILNFCNDNSLDTMILHKISRFLVKSVIRKIVPQNPILGQFSIINQFWNLETCRNDKLK